MTSDGLRGFCIGTADLVPGVSGSTVAVLLGVYERLLRSAAGVAGVLTGVLRGDFREAREQLRRIDWRLVIPLGAGVGVALGVLAGVVDWLLTNRAEATAGAFAGLVCAAVVAAVRQVHRWRWPLAALALAVGAACGWGFGLVAEPVSAPAGWLWFAAGALGVCAMMLPGVSGAFVLLMAGVYAPFIDALSQRDWRVVGLVAGGALVGALAFAKLLARLFNRHHDVVMAVIVGLMGGSLRVLWPWPNGVGILGGPDEVISGTGLSWPDRNEVLWPTVCAVMAFALSLSVARQAQRSTAGTAG